MPPFLAHKLDAVRCALRQVASIDIVFVWSFSSQPEHDPREYTHVTPSLPTVLERLVWTVFLRHITPAKPIVVDEDYATKDTPFVHLGHTMALSRIRSKTPHLFFAQPIKIADIALPQFTVLNHAAITASSSLMGPEPEYLTKNGSKTWMTPEANGRFGGTVTTTSDCTLKWRTKHPLKRVESLSNLRGPHKTSLPKTKPRNIKFRPAKSFYE